MLGEDAATQVDIFDDAYLEKIENIKLPNTKIQLLQQLLKMDLIMLLADHGYPPVDRDEVYQDIFEQAENFKKFHS